MNPQAFNRYSYCLNNPLKYTDPSGRQYTTASQALNAWGMALWAASQAQVGTGIEGGGSGGSSSSGGKSNSGTSGGNNKGGSGGAVAPPQPASPPTLLPSGPGSSSNTKVDSPSLPINKNPASTPGATGNQARGGSQASDVTKAILANDLAAILGDAVFFIPGPTTLGGYGVSAVASYGSWSLTYSEWKQDRASNVDFAVSTVNLIFGLVPGFGIIPAFVQFGYDYADIRGWLPW